MKDFKQHCSWNFSLRSYRDRRKRLICQKQLGPVTLSNLQKKISDIREKDYLILLGSCLFANFYIFLNLVSGKILHFSCLTFQPKTGQNWAEYSKTLLNFKKFNSEIDFLRCHQTDKKSLICNLFWENCSLIKIWNSELLITFLQQREAQALTVRTDKIPE